MIPLVDVQLDYVHNDLKGDDNDLKQKIVLEIINHDSVVGSHHCLFIKGPQQKHEKWGVE